MTDNTNDFQCNPKILRGHIVDLEQLGKDISSATGAKRAALKEILKSEGYHKKALAGIQAIDGMSKTGRADFLRTYRPMFIAMDNQYWKDEGDDMVDVSGVDTNAKPDILPDKKDKKAKAGSVTKLDGDKWP